MTLEPEIKSDAMGVSRGFRRLSVLSGLAGAAFVGFLWIDSPAAFVLVLGGVVAGFRQGD
jgi:hypothetical protein